MIHFFIIFVLRFYYIYIRWITRFFYFKGFWGVRSEGMEKGYFGLGDCKDREDEMKMGNVDTSHCFL